MTMYLDSKAKLLLSLSLPLYIIDQISKFWIVLNFPEPGFGWKSIAVMPDFFNMVRVHNTGMAFGLGNGQSWSVVAFPCVLITAFVLLLKYWNHEMFTENKWSKIARAFVAAGITGNLTDRLVQGFMLDSVHPLGLWDRFRSGYVVDFLDFQFGTYHWPSFNVADSCICISAACLVMSILVGAKNEGKMRASE